MLWSPKTGNDANILLGTALITEPLEGADLGAITPIRRTKGSWIESPPP